MVGGTGWAIPGWTRPGVVGLAGATALFKQNLTPPGQRTVVAGVGHDQVLDRSRAAEELDAVVLVLEHLDVVEIGVEGLGAQRSEVES